MKPPARNDVLKLLIFTSIFSLGTSGMLWYGLKDDLLGIIVSATVFSTVFRAMSFELTGRDMKKIFSTETDGVLGHLIAYSHVVLISLAFLFFSRSLEQGLYSINTVLAMGIFSFTYVLAHYEAKGGLI